jgi:hypothetical protein
VSEDAKPVSIEIALGELRIMATRALIAWDGTVLSKSRDGLMFERMEDLRAVLDALAVKPDVSAEDARRLDVIQAHTAGDIMICPPGNHGGSDQAWLVSFEDDRDRYGSICREYEGTTARQAIDAAIAALEDKDPV